MQDPAPFPLQHASGVYWARRREAEIRWRRVEKKGGCYATENLLEEEHEYQTILIGLTDDETRVASPFEIEFISCMYMRGVKWLPDRVIRKRVSPLEERLKRRAMEDAETEGEEDDGMQASIVETPPLEYIIID